MTDGGCCAATASGPEKSRQIRQEASCRAALFEATASICAILGRDARGTGGGAATDESAGVPLAVFPDTCGMVRTNLSGGGGSRRIGSAGADSSVSAIPGERAGLLGSRGGSDGEEEEPFRAGRAGIDLLGSSGGWTILAAVTAFASSLSWFWAASRSLLDGGSCGKVAWSNAGGSFRFSVEPVREREDMVDLTDSPELRRTASDWTDGLLGGKDGDVSDRSESRLGVGGARLLRIEGEVRPLSLAVLLLWGSTGGAFLTGRAGTVGVAFCEWPFEAGEAAVCA